MTAKPRAAVGVAFVQMAYAIANDYTQVSWPGSLVSRTNHLELLPFRLTLLDGRSKQHLD
jgi:hypothetical protein